MLYDSSAASIKYDCYTPCTSAVCENFSKLLHRRSRISSTATSSRLSYTAQASNTHAIQRILSLLRLALNESVSMLCARPFDTVALRRLSLHAVSHLALCRELSTALLKTLSLHQSMDARTQNRHGILPTSSDKSAHWRETLLIILALKPLTFFNTVFCTPPVHAISDPVTS